MDGACGEFCSLVGPVMVVCCPWCCLRWAVLVGLSVNAAEGALGFILGDV